MDTVRARACQTLCALLAACLCPWVVGRANPPVPPTNWRQEVSAARVLEAALLVTPAGNPAEQAARQARLEDLYRKLGRNFPREAGAQKAAADYLTREGQPAASLPFWEKAAQLAPDDADTSSRLGGVYLRLGRTRDAYARFQAAMTAEPGVASYHFDLANVLYLFRQDLLSPPFPGLPDEQAALTRALGQFRRAAELAPTDLRLAQAYAETFYVFAKPDWAEALAAWENVLRLSGDHGDFPNSHLARISLRLGRPEAAVGYLARIHDPTFDRLKAQLLEKAAQQRAPAR